MAFWSKSDQTRVNDTIAFIVGKCVGPEQAAVRKYLTDFVAEKYAGENLRLLSDSMSTSTSDSPGDKQTRAARRALVLLNTQLLNPGHPLFLRKEQVMDLPSPMVMRAVDALLPGFRMFAAQEVNATLLLQGALNLLTSAPATFLQKNIMVTQSSNSATGIGKVEEHRFLYSYRNQGFVLVPVGFARQQGVKGNGVPVNAVNVPEMFWFQVPGRNADPAGLLPAGNFATIPCTELAGANLMITSAFSGCSFCFKETGGRTYAAHISPDGTDKGHPGTNIGAAPALADQIIATGNFARAVAGPLRVFGRSRSNIGTLPTGYAVGTGAGLLTGNCMYVVGVKISGRWRLIYQQNTAAGRTVGRLN